jgi:hypothetical protein
MSLAHSPVAAHRARRERQGFLRVEVSVHQEDAALVRRLARDLADPASQAETRRFLRAGLEGAPVLSLKALLASAPFDGIEFERDRDFGRDVDL